MIRQTLGCCAVLIFCIRAYSQPLDPASFYRTFVEAETLLDQGQFSDAAARFESLIATQPNDASLLEPYALALYRAGRPQQAVPAGIKAVDAGFGREARFSLGIAAAMAGAGRTEEALRWLERALNAKMENRSDLLDDPRFASLRDVPKFRELAGALPTSRPTRLEGWKHDLNFFVEEVRRLDASPERIGSTQSFSDAVSDIGSHVADWTNERIALELQHLLARLGSGHSGVWPLSTERIRFGWTPIQYYVFEDGLFIVGANTPYQELVGQRVVLIGGRDVDSVLAEIAPYVNHDNEQGIKWFSPMYLTHTTLLEEIGVMNGDKIALTLASGDTVAVMIDSTMAHPFWNRLPDRRATSMDTWLGRRDEAFWSEDLPDLNAFLIQFNDVRDRDDKSIADFASEVRHHLRQSRASNLIVDVRNNGGGDNTLVGPLVRLVAWHEFADDGNRTFVVTSRHTFSAAQNFVNQLDRITDAVFVGEPSSSSPNHTGETTQVRLPWSGLRLSVASLYWQDSSPGDRRPYIPVRIPVPVRSSDYFLGRDPVLFALRDLLAE